MRRSKLLVMSGADVGTNLIDGHLYAKVFERLEYGADVGTNLIDGHGNPPLFPKFLDRCRRRH